MIIKPLGSVHIPKRPLSIGNLLEWAKEVGTAIQQLRDRAFDVPIGPIFRPDPTLPPLWATLNKVNTDWLVIMEDGKVIARDNLVGDCVTTWDIDGIPDKDTPLTVSDGSKVWCKVDEDDSGIVTAAKIESGSDWPESLAPVLKGGDNTSGTPGYRYYRIAEIVTEDDHLKKKQLLTGHIDHFPPTLIDNTTDSSEDNIGKILKVWNADLGRWDLRYLEAHPLIKFTQSDDRILIEPNGKDLNLECWMFAETGSGFIFDYVKETTLCWRKGMFVGKFDSTLPDASDDVVTQILAKFVD